MKYQVKVNNYMVGSRLRSTPIHKIISQETLGKNEIIVIYDLDSIREKEAVERMLGKKLTEIL